MSTISKFKTFLGGRKIHIHHQGSKLICVHSSGFDDDITNKLSNSDLHKIYTAIMRKVQKLSV